MVRSMLVVRTQEFTVECIVNVPYRLGCIGLSESRLTLLKAAASLLVQLKRADSAGVILTEIIHYQILDSRHILPHIHFSPSHLSSLYHFFLQFVSEIENEDI